MASDSRVPLNAVRLITAAFAFIAFAIPATANDELKEKFLRAEFDEFVLQSNSWIEENSGNSIATITLAIANYFLHGEIPDKGLIHLLDDDGLSEVRDWLESLDQSNKIKWPALLLRAMVAYHEGQRQDSLKLVRSAYDKSDQNQYLLIALSVLDENVPYEAVIPKDNPVTYTGNMWLKKQSWVPIDPDIPRLRDYATFAINSGSIETSLGDFSFSADFRDWSYLRSGDDIYSWSAVASEGKILIPSQLSDILDGVAGAKTFSTDISFSSKPFDLFSKYLVVTLDSENQEGFPVSAVRGVGGKEFFLVAGSNFATSAESLISAPGMFGEGVAVLTVTDGNINGPVHIVHTE